MVSLSKMFLDKLLDEKVQANEVPTQKDYQGRAKYSLFLDTSVKYFRESAYIKPAKGSRVLLFGLLVVATGWAGAKGSTMAAVVC